MCLPQTTVPQNYKKSFSPLVKDQTEHHWGFRNMKEFNKTMENGIAVDTIRNYRYLHQIGFNLVLFQYKNLLVWDKSLYITYLMIEHRNVWLITRKSSLLLYLPLSLYSNINLITDNFMPLTSHFCCTIGQFLQE